MKLCDLLGVVAPGEIVTVTDIGGNKLAELEGGNYLCAESQALMRCNVDGIFLEVNDTVGLPGLTVIIEH